MTDQLSADDRAAAEARSADTVDGPATAEPGADGAEADDDRDASDPGAADLEVDRPTGAFARWRQRRRARPTHWDRPPEPHDWRFYVGALGRVLIATGLLMLGFVGYQLWGTGIETARAQNRLETEFEAALAVVRAVQADDEVVDDAVVDDAVVDDAVVDDAVVDDAVVDRPDTEATDEVATTTEPAEPADDPALDGADAAVPPEPAGGASSGGDLAEVAVEQDVPAFDRGDPLALLEIPAIGRSDVVVPGVSLNDLKSGPGHYPDTPLPGQLGNAAIAGHRTTYGAPFFDVDQLAPGDEIIVTMVTGDRFVYEVTGTQVVAATDYWVVATSDSSIAELTLTSCDPKYTARDRIVVNSVLNTAKSSTVGVPTFYDLDTDDEPIAGDDPVLVADDAPTDEPTDEPTSGDDELVPTGDDAGDDIGEPVAEPDEPVAIDDTAGEEPVAATPATADPPDRGDAFVQGWFDDRGAWPQIVLWGAALALIVVLGYRLARRYRRDSLGIVVGIVPFLVALYFFYQNVNRLLPPGL